MFKNLDMMSLLLGLAGGYAIGMLMMKEKDTAAGTYYRLPNPPEKKRISYLHRRRRSGPQISARSCSTAGRALALDREHRKNPKNGRKYSEKYLARQAAILASTPCQIYADTPGIRRYGRTGPDGRKQGGPYVQPSRGRYVNKKWVVGSKLPAANKPPYPAQAYKDVTAWHISPRSYRVLRG
jgi:hypothetical protein